MTWGESTWDCRGAGSSDQIVRGWGFGVGTSIASAFAGDEGVDGGGGVGEAGNVQKEGGEETQGGLECGAADGGEADEDVALSRAHDHAAEGGVDGNGEVGGLGEVAEVEAAEPVEVAEEGGGAAAEAAVPVVVAGVEWGDWR